MIDSTPWAERFRPSIINDCILPESIKTQVKGLIASGNLPSLLFTGGAGCGKTTLARAIANEIGADFMQINASMYGVDKIRDDVKQFASTVSFSDSKKITLLDEADGLGQVAQQAIRAFIEEFSGNHTIIFTCNFPNKIIDAIHSRCKTIDFKVHKADKTALATQFVKRVFTILTTMGVEYDKRAVMELVTKRFPDYRSIWNELQGYAAGGKIDAGILLDLDKDLFSALITSLKSKKYGDARKWIAEHSDMDQTQFFRMFYDNASDVLEPSSIPELILSLGEYSYRSSFVVDQEINTMAFLTSLFVNPNIKFK
jgi:DNA polymerase III delta prime subunit